ncbi:MAG: N-acetylmuramoyl-L-alanine amidase [Alphaproteobacteria bacterium]|nr:MAG: N-acetylmuramoyl-L-alanine amidase [Alphaproteobacteria bacterium]
MIISADFSSPNFEDRRNKKKPYILLLHYTGMKSADLAMTRLCEPASKVSSHYVIGEGGKIFQLVDESKRAFHAGISYWRGEEDINSVSIGIEIVNPGHEFGYREFPQSQMDAVADLCADIIKRHKIKPEFVLGHSDVAVKRKIDPGELFDWPFLAGKGIGLYPSAQHGAQNRMVADVQKMLAAFGYKIEITGKNDEQTQDVVTAFQRHYAPKQLGSGLNPITVGALVDICGQCKINSSPFGGGANA